MNRGVLKTILTLFICFQSSGALALPEEVEAFVGKSGKHVSLHNGYETRQSGGVCKVTMGDSGSDSAGIVIEAPVPSKAQASLKNTKKSVAGNGALVFTTTEFAQRVGVLCAESVPVTNYRKTVEIKDNAIVIRQKFGCGFFDKNDLMSVCDLN